MSIVNVVQNNKHNKHNIDPYCIPIIFPSYPNYINHQLVGGLEHFIFFHILAIIIPTDFHIFQRGTVGWNHQPGLLEGIFH